MQGDTRWPWLEVALTASLACVAIVALFGAGVGGWTGRPDGCLVGGQCFCELDRGGLLRQPANTLSNLGFVVVGLAIAAAQSRGVAAGSLPRPGNPMTGTRFYPGFYAAVTALLGPGSMALHASLTWWGSVLDLVSMNLFIGFVFSYAVVRWRGLGAGAFIGLFAGVNALLLAVKLIHGHGSGAFGALALATFAIESYLHHSGRIEGETRWLMAAAGVFVASFAVWLASHNDGPLCSPESWLQGHAFWHLGCSITTGLLFVYLRSEHSSLDAAR